MRKIVFSCLWIVFALTLSGCAVAVTANVVMPENYARGLSAQPVLAEALKAEQDMMDIEVPEDEAVSESAVKSDAMLASAREALPPSEANEAQLSVILSPQPTLSMQEALLETPALTEKPTPEITPSHSPAQKEEYEIKSLEKQTGYVEAKSVNLRSGPDTKYEILGEYERYDSLSLRGESGDWYYVKIDGKKGFMLKEYVCIGAVPTAEPTPSPTPKPTKKPEATAAPTIAPTQAPLVTAAPSTNTTALSEELYLVAQLVNEETGADGYLAVSNVIYNRWKSSKFPNTLAGVVFQNGQFTPADDEAQLRAVKPSSGAIAAVQQIFVDGNLIMPENVLFFRSARKGTSWGGRSYYATIGGNAFFY